MDLCRTLVRGCLSRLKRSQEVLAGLLPEAPQDPSVRKAGLWNTDSPPRLTHACQPGVLVESEPKATLALCLVPSGHPAWIYVGPLPLHMARPAVTLWGQISSLHNRVEAFPVIGNRPHHTKTKCFRAGTPQLCIVGHRPGSFLVAAA